MPSDQVIKHGVLSPNPLQLPPSQQVLDPPMYVCVEVCVSLTLYLLLIIMMQWAIISIGAIFMTIIVKLKSVPLINPVVKVYSIHMHFCKHAILKHFTSVFKRQRSYETIYMDLMVN